MVLFIVNETVKMCQVYCCPRNSAYGAMVQDKVELIDL